MTAPSLHFTQNFNVASAAAAEDYVQKMFAGGTGFVKHKESGSLFDRTTGVSPKRRAGSHSDLHPPTDLPVYAPPHSLLHRNPLTPPQLLKRLHAICVSVYPQVTWPGFPKEEPSRPRTRSRRRHNFPCQGCVISLASIAALHTPLQSSSPPSSRRTHAALNMLKTEM